MSMESGMAANEDDAEPPPYARKKAIALAFSTDEFVTSINDSDEDFTEILVPDKELRRPQKPVVTIDTKFDQDSPKIDSSKKEHQLSISDGKYYLPDNEFSFEVSNGKIDLSFQSNPEFGESNCFPPSYYTLSSKERLLLYYAENFRRQFASKYPKRRPLVLAPKNSCDVTKFVSTTIRPTAFLFPKLKDSVQECSDFVADYIIYKPLDNPIALPERLLAPTVTLKVRIGTSFDMATLLCSLLIGAGHPAMVVSGVARHETTLNNQLDVECPFIPEDDYTEMDKPEADSNDGSDSEFYPQSDDDIDYEHFGIKIEDRSHEYFVKTDPDLDSHLSQILNDITEEKEKKLKMKRDESNRIRQEYLDTLSPDKFHNQRSHAWVVVIENAPWSIKKCKKEYDADGNEIEIKNRAYFIEPSTGFRHEVNVKNYIFVDSIWNHMNYYVNRQECRPKDMEWDLNNLEHWEHFLPGEPPEMRVENLTSDMIPAENEDTTAAVMVEKHLDFIRTWVNKIHISETDFEQRFAADRKLTFFKNCAFCKYSPYTQRDGKIIEVVKFVEGSYTEPMIRWKIYENRADLMTKIKVNFQDKSVVETFVKGRPDSLKYYLHGIDLKKPKKLYFYHTPRFDALKLLEIHPNKIIFHYAKNRADFCYYREFQFKIKNFIIELVIEKFHRNKSKIAYDDIATRKFLISEGKIFLQFHYARGAVAASTRVFLRPKRPSYGEDIIFDPKLTYGYDANVIAHPKTSSELYKLLLEQLAAEEAVAKLFEVLIEEINVIIEKRQFEMQNSVLKFLISDSLRNEAARNNKMKQFEAEEKRRIEVQSKDADFLAPHLVLYKKIPPSRRQSWDAYDSCLIELKTRYIRLLNGLQTKYEDLTAESKALKKFLTKFQDQFDQFDYERLVQEVKDIELNKRMVQQRLTLTHEEAQNKYEKVKKSLLVDPRLNLADSVRDSRNPVAVKSKIEFF